MQIAEGVYSVLCIIADGGVGIIKPSAALPATVPSSPPPFTHSSSPIPTPYAHIHTQRHTHIPTYTHTHVHTFTRTDTNIHNNMLTHLRRIFVISILNDNVGAPAPPTSAVHPLT